MPNYNFAVASLITLDDFTEENGATWYLPGSHLIKKQPEEEFFYRHAERLIVPKGSVFYFNPRLWHAGGMNRSATWRNSLIIAYAKPWMKQRVDIPRFMAHIDRRSMSDEIKQLLGFYSQPPSSFDEFYGESEERTFTQPFV
jgi:ectoine hydroxylase-related dioxygenase (phytanoyl-CoA dioxygenase family)